MKVSDGLVLSQFLSVILSLSKVKRRQKINGQDHLTTWIIQWWYLSRQKGLQRYKTSNGRDHPTTWTSVLHSLTLWKVSTNLRYDHCNQLRLYLRKIHLISLMETNSYESEESTSQSFFSIFHSIISVPFFECFQGQIL